MGWMKNMIRNWLEIKSPDSIQIDIEQLNNYESQAFINNIWYRGDPNEIQQLYEQLNDKLGNKHFWGSKPTVGMNIRKIHTGLPSMIVDTLADISTDDLDKIEAGDRQEEWNKIAEENNPKALLRDAVVGALVCGDGAFKWSIDTDISQYPIIEYYDGSRVDFEYERGRLIAVIFKTKKLINKQRYTLLERYSKKDITYKLVNKEGKECKIEDYPELINKYKTVINPNEFMMALPVMFRKSKKYIGRGKSLFDGKLDNFDAFDEVWSQWMLALRKGQIKTYIPESLLPRDPETGLLLRGSDLDNDFISVEETISEDGSSKNKIETTQGQIQYEALLNTYITALDQCLTGLISPSTLGIDTKKIDNAEATREKEKTTLYKRNQIVEVLTKVINDMVNITFKVYDTMNQNEITDIQGTASFGGYANPSFEAQIETIGKAKTNGIMSIETSVEELYGDTKDDKWKQEEVQRIKNEQGIVDMEEPSINDDLDLIENEDILNSKVGDTNDREQRETNKRAKD